MSYVNYTPELLAHLQLLNEVVEKFAKKDEQKTTDQFSAEIEVVGDLLRECKHLFQAANTN